MSLRLAALIALACLLVGCGSTAPQYAPSANTLHIVRPALPPGTSVYSPALDLTDTDGAAVQQLYHLTLALPQWKGRGTPINCPPDSGIKYDLHFMQNGRQVLEAVAYATSCRIVALNNNHNDLRVSNTGQTGTEFWQALNQMIYNLTVPSL
jgi:hypothetical protein